jgi:hypothetical protein
MEQGLDVGGGGGGQAGEAVSAFEDAEQAAIRAAGCDFHGDLGEFAEILVTQDEAAERVSAAGIEAGGENDEIRPVGGHGGHEFTAEGANDFGGPEPAGNGQFSVVPLALPAPASSAAPVPGYHGH